MSEYPYKWSFNLSIWNGGVMVRVWRGNHAYTWYARHPFTIERKVGV